MIIKGILNPQILSLIAHVRHTNLLVISDRGFPYWPGIETIDLSLVDDVPTVLQVFDAIRPNFSIGRVFMANEFLKCNTAEVIDCFSKSMSGLEIVHEGHIDLKKRLPHAIGLIRTADTIQYANMILESG